LGLCAVAFSSTFVRASPATVFFIQIRLQHLYQKYFPASPAALHHSSFLQLLPAVYIAAGATCIFSAFFYKYFAPMGL
jgi:hypothetical protein